MVVLFKKGGYLAEINSFKCFCDEWKKKYQEKLKLISVSFLFFFKIKY